MDMVPAGSSVPENARQIESSENNDLQADVGTVFVMVRYRLAILHSARKFLKSSYTKQSSYTKKIVSPMCTKNIRLKVSKMHNSFLRIFLQKMRSEDWFSLSWNKISGFSMVLSNSGLGGWRRRRLPPGGVRPFKKLV